jgi:hypothetical protein
MTSGDHIFTEKTGSQTLCANLAIGIHAAAQPLAVLQASLSEEHTARMSAAELRHLAADSALEVERVCTLFNCMQQLVMAESEPQLSAHPLLPMLEDAVEGVSLLFHNDGVSVIMKFPDASPQVLAHPSRTLHALSGVLLVAHALSSQGDSVELAACESPSSVHIAVRNANSFARAISSEIGLHLAIAAANIRSQHGNFSHQLQPFEVHMELRQALGEP